MYEQLIDLLQPKPKFNLRFYKGEDLYSDGDIEDVLIQIIAEHEPEDYIDAISQNFCWPVYYHLTNTRRNILNWYPFNSSADVLEIGCGMGAITGLLCQQCKTVTAVELSKRRATGTLLRCRKRDNLEIIVGNLNDIQFEKKFDYITLIGVLEYQGSYTDTEHPYLDFLKKIKTLLKPNGKLLIAIENQYGLKYWCGAREDHTGIPFDGINQYQLSYKKIRTFSKETLKDLLIDAGLNKSFFYYPMPDYKLPKVIYSQDYLPHNEILDNATNYYIPDGKTMIVDELLLYRDLLKNNVFEFFANSFLVETSMDNKLGEVKYASLNEIRINEYRIGTRIIEDGFVQKFSLPLEDCRWHIKQILFNERDLIDRGLKVVETKLIDDILISKKVDNITMEDYMLSEYHNWNITKIYSIWGKLKSEIMNSSEIVDWKKNLIYELDDSVIRDKEIYGYILKRGYVDMILSNAFSENGSFLWFDQEWMIDNVPVNYILYRAMKEFYLSFQEAEEILPLKKLLEVFDLLPGTDGYEILDSCFFDVVINQKALQQKLAISKHDFSACVDNINKII